MNPIKSLLRLTGKVLSYVLPLATGRMLRACVSNVYTGFLQRRFMRFGANSAIAYRAASLRGLHRIAIGSNCQIESGVQLTAWETPANRSPHPLITIGNGAKLRHGAHITASNGILIGDNLLTGTNVIITDNAHGESSAEHLLLPPDARPVTSKGTVRIGRNVWLSNNVCVLPGVTIGDGAIVGANSVVTHDVPPYSVAAGVPARVVKQVQQAEQPISNELLWQTQES